MLIQTLSKEENLEAVNILAKIEQLLEIKIPPLYSKFITTFNVDLSVGEDNSCYLDKYLRAMPLIYGSIYSEQEKGMLFFESFIQLKKHLVNLEMSKQSLNSYKMLNIGRTIEPPGLFLGIEQNNSDKIYWIEWENNNGEPSLIAEDIFDLLVQLKIDFRNESSQDATYIKKFPEVYYQKEGVEILLKEDALIRLSESYKNAIDDSQGRLSFKYFINKNIAIL